MSLDKLKQQRANIRRNITRIRNIVDPEQEADPQSADELHCRLGILEAYFKQLMSVQSSIEDLDSSDVTRGEIEESYISTKLIIKRQLGEATQHDNSDDTDDKSELNVSPSPITSMKLPRIALPTFDGRYAEYKNFISLFRQVIGHQTCLSPIEKFNQLINCLKGAALETVKAFQVTAENYPKALQRLKDRYDNPTLVFLDNINSLFQLPSVGKPNSLQLRSLIDNASALFDSLNSLGDTSQIAQAMLIYVVMEKVDQGTKRKWNESLNYAALPTWDLCVQVVERHCQFLESFGQTDAQANRAPAAGKPRSQPAPRQGLSFNCTTQVCVLCSSSDHRMVRCTQLKDMSVEQRFETAKRHSLCLNCLGKGHQASKCPSTQKCRVCARPHHTLLHRDSAQPRSASVLPVPLAAQSQSYVAAPSNDAVAHTHINKPSEHVILATAIVLVRDASGGYRIGRALLDSCSQVNFISEEFAQALRLQRQKRNMKICSIGDSHSHIKFGASTTIRSRLENCEFALDFCVTPHIAYQPDTDIDTSSWNLPQNAPLADEQFHKTRRIDLLIGTETFFEILSVGQIKLGPGLPTLQKTLLGWVVSGRYESTNRTKSHSYVLSLEETINKNMEQLWRLEDVSVLVDKLTPEQRQCDQVFTRTVKQQPDGRVVVRLPFKDDPSYLGRSFDTAKRRFLALERRLNRTPEVKATYVEFMKEFEQLNHMSLVVAPNLEEPHYYIPHHCVFKMNSTSTRLRVVFDASSQTSSQRSLNDVLMVGPTIQTELYMLLIRFRMHRYAITADVVKMFRQVLVDPRDRKFQYVLWRNSPDEELLTYELNTVTYGTAAAPFLAVRAMMYLADLHSNSSKLGAEAIKLSFYVDDLLCGHDSVDGLRQLKEEVIKILQEGKFELAKWHSNHPEFVDDNTVKDLNLEDTAVTSTLGLAWNQQQDAFLFAFQPKKTFGSVTKRTILSLASSLFDPLGLVSPVVIVAKIILQELWLLKLEWDETIPQHMHQAWTSFLESLSSLESLKIPRYCLQPNPQELQLHGFCDASIRAYGCCVYARTVDGDGMIKTLLITSKSRVAPTRKLSVPKLELAAAHLLALLFAKIRDVFATELKTFLWSDSQTVLHWIQQHSATLSTYVGNRVSDIQENTDNCIWRYVPTRFNPADLVSRGCTPSELQDSNWFQGPAFLAKSSNHWPVDTRHEVDLEILNLEKRKSAFKISVDRSILLEFLQDVSSHNRCLRIVGWMLRFALRSTRKIPLFDTPSPGPQELQRALHCIVWNIQQQNFSEEICALRKGQEVSSHIKFLNPFLQSTDGYMLMKVGGRLELADVPEAFKHPILLPSKDDFVRKYVQFLHRQNYHAGPKALVGLIRQKFWIVNARDLARSIVKACVHCVRYKPKLQQQVMGQLPVERLSPSRPFTRCGVDFCGPVSTYLRIRGKGPIKSYIAIFVCFASKAVHIEVVSDLSTDAFLAALKRMIARRGLPSDIFCDNATNFVGASNQLKDLQSLLFKQETQRIIVNFCTNEFINFHFIPPRAPHFGGLWEAAVKSAKGLMTRSLMNARLTFEELTTVTAEVEAVLNSRPLSPLSPDPNDLGVLTPGHFLTGAPLRALPEYPVADERLDHLERWRRVTGLRQHFWQLWLKDYVSELQARSKWTKTSASVSVGDLVLVHEDNLPPQKWIMGRITATIPGKDQRVRVADVRTIKGVIRRPIHKLALLPVS